MSSADQAEIDTNRQTVLLNIAAVQLAVERHGQAVSYCTRVLDTEPTNIKALLRRAKALASRHDYQVGPMRLKLHSPLSAHIQSRLDKVDMQSWWTLSTD